MDKKDCQVTARKETRLKVLYGCLRGTDTAGRALYERGNRFPALSFNRATRGNGSKRLWRRS